MFELSKSSATEMKNIRKYTYIALVISSLLFTSACKKQDDHKHDEKDTTVPVVTVTVPMDMQTYKSGDSVFVKGTVTDNSLHELSIVITRDSDTSELYRDEPVVHDMTSYTFNSVWLSGLSSGSVAFIPATVTITAEDHAGNKGIKKVGIRIVP